MVHIVLEVITLILHLNWILIKSMIGLFFSPKRKDVTGKVILLTGSAHGIGKEMATMFYKLGAHLALIDINQQLNNEVVRSLQYKKESKVLGYQCDLTNEEEIVSVTKRILNDFGNVDILINNAGYVKCAPLMELKSQDIRRTFDVNIFAHFWMIKQLLPSMLERKSGHIVAISSIASLLGTPNLVDYCSSKFAVTGMMDALGCELRSLDQEYIKLTTICPSAISTGMFKKPKTRFANIYPVLTPEYTAAQIVETVLEEKKLVTIPKFFYYNNLIGKMLPNEAFNLLTDFFTYGVDKH